MEQLCLPCCCRPSRDDDSLLIINLYYKLFLIDSSPTKLQGILFITDDLDNSCGIVMLGKIYIVNWFLAFGGK